MFFVNRLDIKLPPRSRWLLRPVQRHDHYACSQACQTELITKTTEKAENS
jgi:hypothetical protein